MTTTAPTITETAQAFFDAVDQGLGWEVCRAYCHQDATFSAQAEPFHPPYGDVRTLEQYSEWMKAVVFGWMPDGTYEIKSMATDVERNNVCGFGIFTGTHSGPGGPVEPTGKRTVTDYVYFMQFRDNKISHMTKIWHSGLCMKEMGWVD
jgi:ketosteroid isomerase-like protein